jgi:hypothetical protein
MSETSISYHPVWHVAAGAATHPNHRGAVVKLQL